MAIQRRSRLSGARPRGFEAARRPEPVRRPRRDGRRGESGAALVEFALVVPLLLLIVFGIISYGLMLTLRQSMSQAAAEGARAAATTVVLDQRQLAARSAVDDAMSAHSVRCTDTRRLTRDGQEVGTCAVSDPAPCSSGATQRCVTVTLTYDYGRYPLVPNLPGVGLVLPDTLAYAATARVS